MPVARPGAVTAAGVLAIIYGSLFSLCGLVGVASLAAQGGMGQNMFGGGGDANQQKLQKEVEQRLERDVPAYQAFQVGGTILGLAEALALLIGGIGVMSMHGWARTLTLLAALVAMLTSLVQAVYTTVYVIPAINSAFQVAMPALLEQQGAGPKAQEAMRLIETMFVLVAIAMVVIYILVLVYLFIIVVLLCRRHVRAAFAGEGPAYSDAETERLDDRDRPEDDGWGASAPPRNPEDDYRYR